MTETAQSGRGGGGTGMEMRRGCTINLVQPVEVPEVVELSNKNFNEFKVLPHQTHPGFSLVKLNCHELQLEHL